MADYGAVQQALTGLNDAVAARNGRSRQFIVALRQQIIILLSTLQECDDAVAAGLPPPLPPHDYQALLNQIADIQRSVNELPLDQHLIDTILDPLTKAHADESIKLDPANPLRNRDLGPAENFDRVPPTPPGAGAGGPGGGLGGPGGGLGGPGGAVRRVGSSGHGSGSVPPPPGFRPRGLNGAGTGGTPFGVGIPGPKWSSVATRPGGKKSRRSKKQKKNTKRYHGSKY
jgi:hypothetical protein